MTAEEVLKSKLTIESIRLNNSDYTFNKVIEAMELYAEKYHQRKVKNLNIPCVMPRFSKEQLHISRGARTLNIKGFDGLKKEPTATITVIEQWDNDGDGLYDETDDNQWATFYLRAEDIDPIITKLLEIKGFLNGA